MVVAGQLYFTFTLNTDRGCLKKKLLTRIFGCETEENGENYKMQDCIFYFLSNTVRVIKSRTITWVEHTECMGR
jgi:hypothetical protein